MLGSDLYFPYGRSVIQKGEYGLSIHFYLGEDVSGATNKILLRSPRYDITEHAASVGTELSKGVTGSIAFPADQYVSYALQDGDIDTPGTWHVRAISQDGDERKTPWARLTVTN